MKTDMTCGYPMIFGLDGAIPSFSTHFPELGVPNFLMMPIQSTRSMDVFRDGLVAQDRKRIQIFVISTEPPTEEGSTTKTFMFLSIKAES
jgi:hypothetical protein